ncbi:MAG TPA: cytochrome P450 [Acidimicrobiales bacterium]
MVDTTSDGDRFAATEALLAKTRDQARRGEQRVEPRGDHPRREHIDLLDGYWYAIDPHDDWAWMRAEAPVYHDPNSDVWAVTRYQDVMLASKDPTTFSNSHNIRPKTGPVPMMISMDDPAHKRRRMLVNRGFTPRRVRDLEGAIGAICDRLIDGVCERGEADVIADLAAPLPLIVIADLLGVAEEDRADLLRWSDIMLSATTGTDVAALEAGGKAMVEFQQWLDGVLPNRKRAPGDDLISVLAHAEVDGHRLDDESLLWESLLILVGGDETTRHVIGGGTEALLTHPDQMQRLLDDPALIPSAVEEMLRWVSPIKTMSRYVMCEVDFGGQHLSEGDEVLLTYPSANRDADVFDGPSRFDVGREPNDHVAFGFGPHFCLGNSLARLELTIMFERLLRRLGDLSLACDPAGLVRRPSSFISGFEAIPVTFTPSSSSMR